MKCSVTVLWILGASIVHAENHQTLIIESLSRRLAPTAQRASLGSSSSSLEITKWQYLPKPSLSVESVSAAKKDYSYQVDEQVTTLRMQQQVWTRGWIAARVKDSHTPFRLKPKKSNSLLTNKVTYINASSRLTNLMIAAIS
ncbi:hypothetical protein RAE21_18855 [Rhodoferax sp. TBRC 17198]|uniref:hypothetical protein n=1 Tax=Rhodoferax potami TaxID=3068338 RepID=UPI0028BEC489|nr:hypothetical protein [Rhodoferax sp. TBRC 17198]MDT7524414.1 hypothetical protein [Rhodoferax sp. TBRC 17198]